MSFRIANPNKVIRIVTIATLSFLVCWGLAMVLMQVRPFWTDEWRLIYNLKFKSPVALWGPLDFTQQFPRVYLELMKAFTWLFDYSYFIMRLPSFLVGTATIFLCYHLMNKIYKPGKVSRFLFVFILVSSYTFTEYFVQVKQYSMEIFLSLVAIWQLLEVLEISAKGVRHKGRYALLCFSFLAAPFFSYTYPIAAAPIFMVAFLQGILLLRSNEETKKKMHILLLQWLPLFIAAMSIIVFYVIDVSHLMDDKEMHAYWSYRMIAGGSGVKHIIGKCWDFFAQVGSGLIFEIIFGVLGISAFAWGLYHGIKNSRTPKYDTGALLRLYCMLLVSLAIGLFIAGKLPVEPKFNAFTVPSIAVLIIFLLDNLGNAPAGRKVTTAITTILFIGLTGNVMTTALNVVIAPEYAKRMNIYVATENAIAHAQADKLPILITPGVAFPDAITVITPNFAPISAGSVLKTFPAYKVSENLPVYTINDLTKLKEKMKQLPASVTSVLAGDGISFKVINRYD